MILEQARERINCIVKCVAWTPQEDPLKNAECPTGQPYEVRHFWVDHDLFDDPEDALCRLLISAVRADIRHFKKWTKGLDETPILYWRTEPEINTYAGKKSELYARYVVSMEISND